MSQGVNDTVGLVAAAGEGLRLGMGPKAFLELNGRSLLLRVCQTLRPCVNRLIVAAPHELVDRAAGQLGQLATVIAGDDSRFETVWKLLRASDEPVVLIHDPVRPFAGQSLIEQVRDAAREHGAAAACLPATLPLARVDAAGFVTEAIPRTSGTLTTSPVAFQRELLEQALRRAKEDGLPDPTPVQSVLALGHRVKAIECEPTNMKITYPMDWEIAHKVLGPMTDGAGPGSSPAPVPGKRRSSGARQNRTAGRQGP